jgi:hypothetical protein
MDRPKLEVADVFRRCGEAYRGKRAASMSTAQGRLTAIGILSVQPRNPLPADSGPPFDARSRPWQKSNWHP